MLFLVSLSGIGSTVGAVVSLAGTCSCRSTAPRPEVLGVLGTSMNFIISKFPPAGNGRGYICYNHFNGIYGQN
jgi:hypothetical protein